MHIERRITDPLAGTSSIVMELSSDCAFYKKNVPSSAQWERRRSVSSGVTWAAIFGMYARSESGIPHFTSLVNNAFYQKDGSSARAAVYQEAKMGKYVDRMAPFFVWTSQGGTDGGPE